MTDPLSDVLRVVRLAGAYFYAFEGTGSWDVAISAARELRPTILPAAEHLISYHILRAGRCYVGLMGEPPVEMASGDVIVFPHGDPHYAASDLAGSLPTMPSTHSAGRYTETLRFGSGGPTNATMVCGFLGCDRRPFNPLLAALPRVIHLRGLSSAWIGGITGKLTEESQRGGPGADEVVTRLAELMFIEVLRRYLDELPENQTGWLAGLRDPVVGRTLSLLHQQPAHPWTLATLASETGVSRSNLAKRFSLVIGQPPMQYLAQWRMQVAAALLVGSTTKVSAIGLEVGYDSEAAFSRAFKLATGFAPGAWRQHRRAAQR